jgi:hypothetical protein
MSHSLICSSKRNVLVACEFSGVVRDAFHLVGWNAVSCDFLTTDRPGAHYMGDVRDILHLPWDLLVAFPPCTHLAVSGARHFYRKKNEQLEAIEFVKVLLSSSIPRIAVENPVGVISTMVRKPDQIIQPWQFGHGQTKATCLWLKNLSKLTPTDVVEGREQLIWRLPPSKDRWKLRSITFQGIANAMANQWGL